MAKKKTYVLYVVHTDLHQPMEFFYAKELWEDAKVREQKDWELEEYFEEFRKKFQLDREIPELHRRGVIGAMKIFQEAGMPVIYEPVSGNSMDFLEAAEGVKKESIVINKIRYADMSGPHLAATVEGFLENAKKLGLEDFEVVFVGHYTDLCVYSRAGLLKQRGMRPYVVIGTPARLYSLDHRKEVRRFFGEDRVITLHQLRRLLNG